MIPYLGRADQVVGVSLGTGLPIMGHTADHHHGGALQHWQSVSSPENGDQWRQEADRNSDNLIRAENMENLNRLPMKNIDYAIVQRP